jgi:signal peptidase I
MTMYRFAVSSLFVLLSSSAYADELYKMPANVMEPSVRKGSMVVVEDLKYPLRRGDIVLFRWPVDEKTPFMMRIIGLPGDRIQMQNGKLIINGQLVSTRTLNEESGIFEEEIDGVKYTTQVTGRNYDRTMPLLHKDRVRCQYTEQGVDCLVPSGQYFVLGDSRNNSNDSRMWGYLPANYVIGKIGAHRGRWIRRN